MSSLSLSPLLCFLTPTTFHIVSEVQIHLMATGRKLGKFTVFQIGLEFYLTKRNLNSFICFWSSLFFGWRPNPFWVEIYFVLFIRAYFLTCGLNSILGVHNCFLWFVALYGFSTSLPSLPIILYYLLCLECSWCFEFLSLLCLLKSSLPESCFRTWMDTEWLVLGIGSIEIGIICFGSSSGRYIVFNFNNGNWGN